MKKTIIADRVSINRTTGNVSTSMSVRTPKSCQVHMVVDENGNVTDVDCSNVNCGGTCNLHQKDDGAGNTEYWCSCD